jgi:hypothetical protein
VAALLEFDSDAKRGYFHLPRTEKELVEVFRTELSRERKEAEANYDALIAVKEGRFKKLLARERQSVIRVLEKMKKTSDDLLPVQAIDKNGIRHNKALLRLMNTLDEAISLLSERKGQ